MAESGGERVSNGMLFQPLPIAGFAVVGNGGLKGEPGFVWGSKSKKVAMSSPLVIREYSLVRCCCRVSACWPNIPPNTFMEFAFLPQFLSIWLLLFFSILPKPPKKALLGSISSGDMYP